MLDDPRSKDERQLAVLIYFRCPSASTSSAPIRPHLEKPSRNGQKFQKVAQLRPTLLRRTIAIASTYCFCVAFFHSSFIKCSRTSHKKRPRRLGNAAQRIHDACAKLITGTFVVLVDWRVLLVHHQRRRRRVQPRSLTWIL